MYETREKVSKPSDLEAPVYNFRLFFWKNII